MNGLYNKKGIENLRQSSELNVRNRGGGVVGERC